ncbi:MAG: fasciclin domain-containing protein, partial [Candidatus Poseidoniaceae archaeon]
DAGINLSDFTDEDGISVLSNILSYHVTIGAVLSGDLSDGQFVTMLNRQQVRVGVTPGGVIVNDALVTQADVVASNGVIHVIDKVLMPAEPEICYNTETHTIVPGADQATCEGYMYLNNTEMNGQNYTGCYNTVTHQISEVSEAVCGAYTWTAAVKIPQTAAATSIHTSLVAALGVAGLVDTLSGNDNYTVFAPTDEAFAAAGINLSDYDTEEEIAALADILLYHVVAGEIASTDLADGANTVTAANGDELTVTVAEGVVTVGAEGATVVLADVPASNGVIHVIDKVILPPADEPTEPEEPEVVCAATIGITSDGYGFTPASTTIAVGETVCWKWTDESMAHNVKEVAGLKSTTYVENGVYSGAAAKTVDFHHTFTEDTTFYYACEPHIGVEMFGKVIVGDGGAEPAVVDEDKDDKEDNNTPGFLGLTAILATLGAVLFARKRLDNEL